MAIFRNKLVQNVGIYGIANTLNLAVPFFLLPVLTHYLDSKDFAIIALFQAMTNFLFPIVSLNYTTAISVNYFHREKYRFDEYVFNGLFLLFITAITSILFVWFFKSSLAEQLSFPEPWLIWVILYVLFFKTIDLISIIWRVQSKPIPFGVFKLSITIIELTIAILLVVAFDMNWEGRLISLVASTMFFAVISVIILYKKNMLHFKINKDYIKDILKFGIPLIPHSLGAILIVFSDRIFIVKMVGEEALGLYSVGYQIGMVISLIQNSFNQAWTPYFYGKLKEGKESMKLKIVKFTYAYFGFMIVLVVILNFFKDFIFNVFIGEEFSQAVIFVFWIALAFAINGMYKMVVNYFFFLKKTLYVSLITFLAAIINLTLNYFLISMNGALGAAQAAVIAFFVQFVIIWIFAARVYPMPWLFFLKTSNKSD